MSDHINLKRPIDLTEPESTQNLLDVIQAGLGRPCDVSTKAAALADDIRTLGAARRDIGEASEFIEELCGVVVCVAFLLPPGHPWQDTFVQTMQNVQQTDGDYESDEDYQSDEDYESNGDYEQESDEGYASDGDDEQLDEVEFLDWKYLPEMGMFMRDFWFDPTTLDDWTPEEVSGWENLNSFFARFKTNTFERWVTFPIWQLSDALEEKLDKGPILNSRLWIATEWILFYGEFIFEHQASEEKLDENRARALQGGSLCSGIAPLSLARLAFWKKRLLEMLDEREALELSGEMAERVAKSAEMIGEFQSSQSQ
ncbi:Hypothetical protein NCS54_01307400 [Fusarium falciforme]|uniref:Hypothetical protein n=1 Tax=Fusarium falciforme TaxID=195108 RepID=UPI002300EE1E|nr:Hypothetical protein NCS54_01307400 [Fusarium falciforme]WAO95451.1 Hypothetical protein NCS54_01307400 [Fusarium falciforme]